VYSEKLLMTERNFPKQVEFYSKNKLEKLVHLAGFIIRILLISLKEYKNRVETSNLSYIFVMTTSLPKEKPSTIVSKTVHCNYV